MIKQFFTFLIALAISITALAQTNPIDPAIIKMGWGFASDIILKKIKDPLTKEIIIKSVPKIIDQDAKGATLEITDAIYRIKNVRVGNKEFLSQLEINVNDAIKSIKQQDYVTAVNSLAKTASFTETYLKSGILDKPDTKSQVPLSSISKPIVITKADINSKLHIGKNNNYLFYVPTGILSEVGKNTSTTEEEFNIDQDDGKNYNIGVEDKYSPDLKNISVASFQSNKEAETKFTDNLTKTLSTSLGECTFIKSEIATNYNFKALKYQFRYSDKTTSVSSMAYVIIAFNKSTMFVITFKTPAGDFPETKKSFEDFMGNFFIIGNDEISDNSTKSASDNEVKTGYIIVTNSSEYQYDIYIDGVFKKRLAGKSKSEKIPVNEGNNRKLYAKQVSGYAMYPTEKTTLLNVVGNSGYNWTVPF